MQLNVVEWYTYHDSHSTVMVDLVKNIRSQKTRSILL